MPSTSTLSLWASTNRAHCKATCSLRKSLLAVANYTGKRTWIGGKNDTTQSQERLLLRGRKLTVPRISPDPGRYTLILTLTCHEGKEYVQCDYRVFPSMDIQREVQFIRPSFSLGAQIVSLCVERISHNFSNATDSLKLVLLRAIVILWTTRRTESSRIRPGNAENRELL